MTIRNSRFPAATPDPSLDRATRRHSESDQHTPATQTNALSTLRRSKSEENLATLRAKQGQGMAVFLRSRLPSQAASALKTALHHTKAMFASPQHAPLNEQQLRELRQQRFDAVLDMLQGHAYRFGPGAEKAIQEFKRETDHLPITAKAFKKFEKGLIQRLAQHLPDQATSKKEQKKALASAAHALRKEAVPQHLNRQEDAWRRFETTVEHNGHQYTSRHTPAGQIKLGERSIFQKDYDNKGISSGSTSEKMHATNLWISEFSARGSQTPLFQGVRHGINSAYGLKNSSQRKEAALNRAKEVASAALFLKPELLQSALKGEQVTLRLSSTSLVTALRIPKLLEGVLESNLGIKTEGKMIKDQLEAWKTLSAQAPCTLTIHDENGVARTVNVKLDVAAFNFGVNEAALQVKTGWAFSDKHNLDAMNTLFGDDLRPRGAEGGWVAEYLQSNPPNAARVAQLSAEIHQIWDQKLHHEDGGDPYKLARRIAQLSYEIGVVPCYNCKSGKDRTGMMDTELKTDAVLLHARSSMPVSEEQRQAEAQEVFKKVLLNSGNQEIQKANTGVPGNKVLRDHSHFGFNLSYAERIGDKQVFKAAQGGSKSVQS